jgi:superfamily I DNA/RNA helicase
MTDLNKTILVGPPGTGKTTHATRVAYDRYKSLGPKIGYFTFTRRAAHEARDRMRKWLGEEKLELAYFQTIHSLCFNQLGLSKSRVLELGSFATSARLKFSKKMITCFKENQPYTGTTRDDRIVFLIGWARAQGLDKDQAMKAVPFGINKDDIRDVWDMLEEFKMAHSLVDFDDMLTLFPQNGNIPELHTIIVDEAQDTSTKQRLVIEALRRRNPEAQVLWALDGDQTIFEWAGSGVSVSKSVANSVNNIILQQSYRVPEPIHDLAMSVIRRCKDRYPVKWQPAKHEGNVKHVMGMDRVPKEFRQNLIILARNYCYLIPYMKWLRRIGLDYRFLKDNKDFPIRIGTIHESKGLEADNVVLDTNMTKKSWDVLSTDEEKRVWYTGITRARHNLFVMLPHSRYNVNRWLR